MVVKYDEDNFNIKLYRDFVKGKLVGLMEVIPIDELLEVWADHKTRLQVDCSTCRFDDRCEDESICSMCTRHYSDFYQPKIKIELQTNVIDIALAECRVQHNGCKNCNKACVWRNEE